MPFERESRRHPLTPRALRVRSAEYVVPGIRRIALEGPDLAGFAADGPADHVRLLFPDAVTGELSLPTIGPDGRILPPAGAPATRDYTPLDADGERLVIDFVVHGDEGPASAWAASAAPGDRLGVMGPRGSRLAPAMGALLAVVDETAFPALARWERLTDAPITAVIDAADAGREPYFAGSRAALTWTFRDRGDDLLETVRSLGDVAEDTFVFLAGEATTLAPVRRYLRRELGLPREQVSASGYWRRGVGNLDHHAPLDPADPD
ncbi:MAG: siderophore-interacting protein [Microbacteriaceae bacterium]